MPVALQHDELLRLTGAAELRALCAEWRALLAEDPPIAQQIVRKLLTERLTVERTPKGIRLTGMATFGPLMAGIVMGGEMGPPGGGTDSEWRRCSRSPWTRSQSLHSAGEPSGRESEPPSPAPLGTIDNCLSNVLY